MVFNEGQNGKHARLGFYFPYFLVDADATWPYLGVRWENWKGRYQEEEEERTKQKSNIKRYQRWVDTVHFLDVSDVIEL